MYCHECGRELRKGHKFCPYCGTKQDAEIFSDELYSAAGRSEAKENRMAADQSPSPTDETGFSHSPSQIEGTGGLMQIPSKRKYVIVGIVAAFLILLIPLTVSQYVPGYEKPIKNICKGLERGDADLFFKAFPDYIEEDFENQYGDEDNYFYSLLTDLESRLTNSFKISYNIENVQEWNDEELDTLQYIVCSDYNLDYETAREEDYYITKAYYLDVSFKPAPKIFADFAGDEIDNYTIPVGKVDGKWCILTTYGVY